MEVDSQRTAFRINKETSLGYSTKDDGAVAIGLAMPIKAMFVPHFVGSNANLLTQVGMAATYLNTKIAVRNTAAN